MANFGAILSGILGGVGQAGTALAAERQRAEELARQKVRDALVERQVGLAERQYGEEQEGRQRLSDAAATDPRLAAIAPFFKVKGGEVLAKFLVDQVQRERRQRAGQAIAAGIPNAADTMEFTSPEEGAGMSPVPADPQAAAVKAALESGDLDLKEALPFLFPKPTPVSETTVGFLQPGGRYTPLPGGDRGAVPPPAEGTLRTTEYDRFARPSFKDKPIEARDDFDRAAFTITDGVVRRYEDLSPQQRQEANQWVANQPWRNPVVREEGKYLSPEEAGSLGVPYGTRKGPAAAQGPRPLTAAQRTKMDAQNSVLAMIDNMDQRLSKFEHPSGPVGRLLQTPRRAVDVYGQADPALVAAHRQIEGTLALIVRALGEVGTLTDKDIERARALQPTLAPIPDTAEVIQEKLGGLRQLVQEVAARTGNRPQAPPPADPGATASPRTNDPLGIRR